MSTAEAPRRPVEVFLGPDASSGGPFALLDLDPRPLDQTAITAALDRQLARIADHPQGRTPAADEVRLALHAAAAQLMDPAVQQSMRSRWAAGAPARQAPRVATASLPGQSRDTDAGPARRPFGIEPLPSPAPAAGAGIARLDPKFEAEARAIIASAGGATPIALTRLAALAKARGIPTDRVPSIVKLIAAGGSGAPAPSSAGSPARPGPLASPGPARPAPAGAHPFDRAFASAAPDPLTDPFAHYERDDSSSAIKTVTILSLIGILLMAGAFWTVIVVTAPTGPAPAPVREPESLTGHMAEPDPESLFPRAPDGPTANAADPDPVADAALDSTRLVEDFRAAVDAQAIDPAAAAESFARLTETTGASWPEIPLDRRRAIIDLVVEFVYRAAAASDGPVATLEAVAAGSAHLATSGALDAEQVGQATWSIGLLVRLQRERDISARAGSLIEARLGAALEGARPVGPSAFDAGVAAALGVMPARLLPASDQPSTRGVIEQRLAAWRRWIQTVDAVTGADAAARAGLILSGLDVLLRDAAEPTDDRSIFESIALLVEALDFAEGSSARAWLVRTLDAPGVSPADAHALLNAVATRAPDANLDVSMVLHPRATDLERREMRDRLAILWNLADPADRDALASAWREEWAAALERRASDLTPFEHLASAVVLSRISEAALLRWRGLTTEAEGLLQTMDDDIDSVLSPATLPSAAATSSDAGDGVWADQYLQAGRSIPIRIDLLTTLARSTTSHIGPVDAEVLMGEALRGSPDSVSTAARDLVMRLLNSPAVVNALLEALPTIPKTRRNAELVTALTGARLPLIRDERWETQARRAAITRLLEILAADGDMRVYNDLASLLAQSYMVRNESAASIGLPGAPGARADPPEFAAGVLRSRWRRQAEPLLPPPALDLSLDEIDRRRASRLELAEGPVQTFAAEQLASVELMALVVASEQPEQVDPVRAILDDLARARQRARHITEQIAAGEAAAAALWGIRLREGGTP